MAHLRRREWFRAVGVCLLGSVLSWRASKAQAATGRAQTDQQWLERARERMRHATEEDAKEVERLYSTRPIRFTLGLHTYEIPVNYFGPKDFRDWPKKPKVENFGFSSFCLTMVGIQKTIGVIDLIVVALMSYS